MGNWPEDLHRTAKMKNLQGTSDAITMTSPPLFALMLVVCGRIISDGVYRFSYDQRHPPAAIYALDCIIVIWLSFGFVGLTVAHFWARVKDALCHGYGYWFGDLYW